MAKVTLIKENGDILETSPMPQNEARNLYESLKNKNNLVVLQFI